MRFTPTVGTLSEIERFYAVLCEKLCELEKEIPDTKRLDPCEFDPARLSQWRNISRGRPFWWPSLCWIPGGRSAVFCLYGGARTMRQDTIARKVQNNEIRWQRWR